MRARCPRSQGLCNCLAWVVLSNLVQIDPLTYEVEVAFPDAGVYEVTITKTNVIERPRSFSITQTPQAGSRYTKHLVRLQLR